MKRFTIIAALSLFIGLGSHRPVTENQVSKGNYNADDTIQKIHPSSEGVSF